MADMQATEWRGHTMVDVNGDKIGDIQEIYLDVETERPEWALVNTGFLGTRSTFVPLQGATKDNDEVRVPHDKAHVKDAPSIDADQQLSQEQEAELYRYYGLDHTEVRSGTGLPEGEPGSSGGVDVGAGGVDVGTGAESGQQPGPGRDTSGPTSDDAMTRSEEEVDVTKTQREAGRARLRKYVVTEEVTETVPVHREEARVEREPVTEENIGPAMEGPAISEEEHEVTLHEEDVHVDKRAVPKERVHLDTETVTDQEQVSEEVRKEQIEMESDDANHRR